MNPLYPLSDFSERGTGGEVNMKHFFSIIILLILFPFSYIWSSTIIVDINGTGDYLSIQEGINNASDDDIVLVCPGTYYENIDYSGKNITVASKYYTTGDESYINKTIIDGNNNGSCVIVKDGGDEATIWGFTLQHGSGYDDGYDEYGGGIFICGDIISTFNVNFCIIQNNYASSGGGIFANDCFELNIIGSRIIHNFAHATGGGIVKGGSNANIFFSQDESCDIYMNYAPMGSDVYNHVGNMTVYVDTFTVQEPDKFYAYSQNGDIWITVTNHKIEQINQDIYVSPDGNNANNGLNWNNAFINIYYALIMVKSDSTHKNTIYVDEGNYSPSLTGEFFALGGKDYISIIGVDDNLSILDAEQKSNLFEIKNVTDLLVRNLTLKNGQDPYDGGISIESNSSTKFENIILKDNNCNHGVTNIHLHADCITTFNNVEVISHEGVNGVAMRGGTNISIMLNNCKISGNKVNPDEYNFGACSFINNCSPIFINTIISGNGAPISSGVSVTWGFEEMYIINSTIVDNKDCSEGTIRLVDDSHITLINTILRNEPEAEIWFHPTGEPNSASIEYCNIDGGIDAINTNNNGTVYWGDGNIDEDPLFVGGDPFSYELIPQSPCIDAGTPDTTGLNLPATDLAGNPRIYNGRIDIGAYECQDTVSIDPPDTSFIHNLYLFQNTPNPFTNETEILFITADYARVEDYSLSIYNTKGQLVRRFDGSTNDFWVKTKIVWDGTDEYGRKVAPGTYLYKLEYNGHAVVRKMILLR